MFSLRSSRPDCNADASPSIGSIGTCAPVTRDRKPTSTKVRNSPSKTCRTCFGSAPVLPPPSESPCSESPCSSSYARKAAVADDLSAPSANGHHKTQLRHGAGQGVSSALRRQTLHQAQDIPKETPFLSSRNFRMPDQPCLPVFLSWSKISVLGLRTPRRTALMSTLLRLSINRQAVRGHVSADTLR